MRTTLKQINRELSDMGYDVKLVRGVGYYYFTDPFLAEQGVYGVRKLSAFSVKEWVEIYRSKVRNQ